jgi:hypothetical protein
VKKRFKKLLQSRLPNVLARLLYDFHWMVIQGTLYFISARPWVM